MISTKEIERAISKARKILRGKAKGKVRIVKKHPKVTFAYVEFKHGGIAHEVTFVKKKLGKNWQFSDMIHQECDNNN